MMDLALQPTPTAPTMTDRALQPPARECILAYVADGDSGHRLVRETAKLAQELQARWIALYVETARGAPSEAERDAIVQSQRLAAALGGEVVTLPGTDVVDEVLAYAQATGVTQLVIGQSGRADWWARLRGSLARRLVTRAERMPVHVVPVDGASGRRLAVGRPFRRGLDPIAIVVTTALVALVTALGAATRPILEISGVVPMYLAVVVLIAVRYGLPSALLCAALGTLTLDFFFFPPLYHFNIDDPKDSIALACFAVVAVITSQLSGRLRSEMLIARQRARVAAELYSFSRLVAGISALDVLLPAMAARIATMLKARVTFLLERKGELAPFASEPPGHGMGAAALRRAQRVWEGAAPAQDPVELLLPLRTGHGTIGVLWIERDAAELPPISAEERRLVDALADQAAVAIEHMRLAAEIEETRVLRETERLRSALLTSVSHDLRTPLSSVLAALAGLREDGVGRDDASRAELLDTAQEQGERLNRFVGNLLDITRIEGGAIAPRREPADLSDIVGSAVRRAAKLLARHHLAIALDPDLPMLRVDFVLIEQVVFNLLDNAAKYAPPGSTVSIGGRVAEGAVVLEVADEGNGIAETELERIFSKFHRLDAADRQRAGTGLGLAICRGFVEAHGGTIAARNHGGASGAVFAVTLPLPDPGPGVALARSASPAPAWTREPEVGSRRRVR
jgi:two-component system, OmpR family, sensor histidine kinase KdpD